MEKKILNCEYSIFGNFNMIFDNANELVELFGDDYSPELKNEFIPFGGQQEVYTLNSNSLGVIKVMKNRIDTYFNSYCDESLDIYKNILKKFFNKYGEKLLINRIAINLSFFNSENFKELLKELVSKINFMNADNPVELNFHINDQCRIDNLQFNNIIYIQKSILQNGKDFTKFDAIVFGFDFNSLNCKEYENMFCDKNTIVFFEKLQKSLDLKVTDLFKRIEEGIYEK